MIEQFRKRYEILAGVKADKRWCALQIQYHIEQLEKVERERMEQMTNEENKVDMIKTEREANKQRRGDVAEFLERDDLTDPDDKSLRFWMRGFVAIVAKEAAYTKTFIDGVASCPEYALEWADDFYTKVAKIRVAKEIIGMFASGMSLSDMQKAIMHETILAAAKGKSSTSQCSNIMENQLSIAWAQAARNMLVFA